MLRRVRWAVLQAGRPVGKDSSNFLAVTDKVALDAWHIGIGLLGKTVDHCQPKQWISIVAGEVEETAQEKERCVILEDGRSQE